MQLFMEPSYYDSHFENIVPFMGTKPSTQEKTLVIAIQTNGHLHTCTLHYTLIKTWKAMSEPVRPTFSVI